MDARDARALAEEMRARHKKEAEEAWADAEARGVAVEGVENTHENPALEVIAN
jgi:zeaxanthin epoxidase